VEQPVDGRTRYLTVTVYVPPELVWLETVAAEYARYGYRSRSAFICDTLAKAWKVGRGGNSDYPPTIVGGTVRLQDLLWTGCPECLGRGYLLIEGGFRSTCPPCSGTGMRRVPFDEAVERMLDRELSGTEWPDSEKAEWKNDARPEFRAKLRAALGEGT